MSQTQTQVPKVVSRTARVRDKTGGRVVTIAYEHNRDKNELKYGATIFRKDAPNTQFDKKGHRHTAMKRLDNHPVVVQNFEDKYGTINEKGHRKGEKYNLKDLHNDIRRKLYLMVFMIRLVFTKTTQ